MSPEEPPLDEAAARALLAQKEEDLLLAAELGKALLEKNEQLSSENERTAAQYARHLEVGYGRTGGGGLGGLGGELGGLGGRCGLGFRGLDWEGRTGILELKEL